MGVPRVYLPISLSDFCKTVIIIRRVLYESSFILAIGNLRSKLSLLKPPIINAHGHSNARVHQVAKLKTGNKNFFGKIANIKRYTYVYSYMCMTMIWSVYMSLVLSKKVLFMMYLLSSCYCTPSFVTTTMTLFTCSLPQWIKERFLYTHFYWRSGAGIPAPLHQ